MIKLSRAVVERMVLLCLYMKARDFNCFQLLEEALGVRYKKFDLSGVLRDIFHGDGLTRELCDWDVLIDQMVEQLGGRVAGEGHHPALIDTIAEILQGPYAKSVLGGRTLQSLKRAILLPEELSKVGESATKELHCTSCGKALVELEMITFSNDGGELGFFCGRCAMPRMVACKASKDCDGASPVDIKLLDKAIGKPDCGTHGKEAPGPVVEANPFAGLRDAARANQPARAGRIDWQEVGRMQANVPAAPPPQQANWIGEDAQIPGQPIPRNVEPPVFRARRAPRPGGDR